VDQPAAVNNGEQWYADASESTESGTSIQAVLEESGISEAFRHNQGAL
jgi:hypothetical protein